MNFTMILSVFIVCFANYSTADLEDGWECIKGQPYYENRIQTNYLCCAGKGDEVWIYAPGEQSCCENAERPVYTSGSNQAECSNGKVIALSTGYVPPTLDYRHLIEANRVVSTTASSRNSTRRRCSSPISKTCCNRKQLSDKELCDPQLLRPIRKEHPLHDSVCRDRTYQRGNETCFMEKLFPSKKAGKRFCGGIRYNEKKAKCCNNRVFKNAASCCNRQAVFEGEICCGDRVYKQRASYRCHQGDYIQDTGFEQRSKSINVYFFFPSEKVPSDQHKTVFKGTLATPNDDIKWQIRKNFYVEIRFSTKKVKANQKWYLIFSKKRPEVIGPTLKIQFSKDILPLTRKTSRKLNRHLQEFEGF